LYQGLYYYSENKVDQGMMSTDKPKDIQVVAVIDVDKRKVGKTFKEAIFAKSNCTPIFYKDVEDGPWYRWVK